MFRQLGIVILAVCLLSFASAVRPGHAALIPADEEPWLRCSSWTSVADKLGTERQLYPVRFDKSAKVRGESREAGRPISGTFDVPANFFLGLLSQPDNIVGLPSKTNSDDVSVQFTVPSKASIQFDPDRPGGKSILATWGFLELPLTSLIEIVSKFPATICMQRDTVALGESARGGKLDSDLPKSLSALANKEPGKAPDGKADPASKSLSSFADPPNKSLTDFVGGEPNKAPAAKADAAEPTGDPTNPANPANKDPKTAAPKGPTAIPQVCSIDTLQPMPVAAGIGLKPLQTVGIRNTRNEARKFDYQEPPADAAIRLSSIFDLTDSRGKLVPYDSVAVDRSRDPADLWVSLTGVAELRPAVKPESLLRIIVVGGPAEVAMSGLAEVGAELKKQGGGRISLDIEWHVVGPSGLITGGGTYSSFDDMVKAAAEKAAGAPDVLNEEQLQRLLDDFENVLKARSEPVEKVFWIKGAYSVPSSIPPRFERFIQTVNSNEAIAGASGRPRKWLVIVTARMTGFSINYLKESIYSLQIGDLIEEGDAAIGLSRRFIKDRDTTLLATRLQIAAVRMPAPAALTGRLVLRATDVFEQRGYVLSQETIRALQNHLQLVASKWVELADSRASWAAMTTRKAAPTVVDLVQNADEGVYLRLPRILPDWGRKGIRDLTTAEVDSAGIFIGRYLEGVERAAANTTDKRGNRCKLFYAPEAFFGFGKQ
jgi:hypothetical protein